MLGLHLKIAKLKHGEAIPHRTGLSYPQLRPVLFLTKFCRFISVTGFSLSVLSLFSPCAFSASEFKMMHISSVIRIHLGIQAEKCGGPAAACGLKGCSSAKGCSVIRAAKAALPLLTLHYSVQAWEGWIWLLHPKLKSGWASAG